MTEAERIECKVAPWYYRRMGLIMLVLAGCGAWFLYDGMVGWPRGNHKADLYEAFQAGREGTGWKEVAEEKGWPEETAGDERMTEVKGAYDAAVGGETWSSYSAERRLPAEKPKRHPQSAIEGQFHWAYGSFVLAGLVLLVTIINLPKKLTADGTAFFTASKRRVPFDKIFRVDKKKWDNKGLAYAYYKDEKGKERKATIDDLKFRGAVKILDRVLERFEGEVIERAPIEDDEEEEDENEEESEEGEGGVGESEEESEGEAER